MHQCFFRVLRRNSGVFLFAFGNGRVEMGYALRCVRISLRLLRSVGVRERSLGVRYECIGLAGLAFSNRLLCVGDGFGQMIFGHGDRRRKESSEAQTDSENKNSTVHFDVSRSSFGGDWRAY